MFMVCLENYHARILEKLLNTYTHPHSHFGKNYLI